jgi:hypothetical protein
MDSRLRFRPRFFDDEPPGDPGTKLVRSQWIDRVKAEARKSRDPMPRPKGKPAGQDEWSRRARKAWGGVKEASVP